MARTAPTITVQELNRATLARQMLLERHDVGPATAVARLAGMQAQEARPPFIGLWTRLADVDVTAVRDALHDGSLVRATWLRATLHLVTGDDYRAHRTALQPALTAAMKVLGSRADGLDLPALTAQAEAILRNGPLTFAQLRPLLGERFPDADERALGYAIRTQLPLIMVPTDDRWGFPASATFAPAAHRLTGPLVDDPDPRALLRTYLAAFGPASATDAQAWSGLRGLAAVLAGMGDELVTFTDPRGRTLYDLPDAPRPGADVPAPARLLPDFDNLVLAHDDRSRVIADAHRPHLVTKNLRVRATFLVDGRVAGIWSAQARRGIVTITLVPFGRLTADDRRALTREAKGLAPVIHPEARDREVVFAAPGAAEPGGATR